MILMVENGIRGGICQVAHRYAKANNKYMKSYDNSIDSSYLAFLETNNLYGWGCLKNYSKRVLNGWKNFSKFNEVFIKKIWWK